MNIISHVAYPLLVAQSVNIARVHNGKTPFFKTKHLLLIGVCGGLPDILSPHLSLQARYSSFSHSLWFLLLTASATFALARTIPKHKKLAYFCFFAAAFHLFCDMIAGGINLWGPYGKLILGKYFVPYQYWIPLDIAALLLLSVSFLHSLSPIRARSLLLVAGCTIAVCGAWIAFSTFDIEAFLTKKIPASEISAAHVDKVRGDWDALLAKWRYGEFERLSNNFAEEMRKEFTPERQRQFSELMKSIYGDYQGLIFVEAIGARFFSPQMTVYRFRAAFSRTTKQPEIGIVVDRRGKISGLRFREKWKDKIM